ncbi:MAG: precorrin-8X methylmutase [Desulfovibrio sp.]|jgi:precorrin-8X/cobalt-precorrin-8 methylmutase|nr:precorrin-8X methylmutase [Desulfovibrio sp.]
MYNGFFQQEEVTRDPGLVLDPAGSPEEIEARSFAIIDAEAGGRNRFSGRARVIARRIVHAGGDLDLFDLMYLPEAAVDAGIRALKSGVPIYADTRMLCSGIPLRRLGPFGTRVVCIQDVPGLAEEAAALGVTRARAAVGRLKGELGGSIFAVGNSPTALLALLGHLEAGGAPPALVVAMPVGFVNAEQSKELVLRRGEPPVLALRGRRGGSPLAAAAINALAELAAEA